jgi:peptidoglycan hydrolase-like protein with peptidoglycan-binding domain
MSVKAIEKLIAIANAEIGYLEKKNNSQLDDKTANAGAKNYTKYARDLDAIPGFYNGRKNGYAWCDVFTDWCFVQAFGVDMAKKLLCQPNKSLGAGCKYSYNYYKQNGQAHTTPQVGDQVFFSTSGSICHTGIVYRVDDTYVYTIEGNTSSAAGVVTNGGCVRAKKYELTYASIVGYGRPNYALVSGESDTPSVSESVPASKPVTSPVTPEQLAYKPTVFEWQKAAMADGFTQPKYFPKYGADDDWGKECEAVAKKAVVKKRITYKYRNLTKIVQKVVGFIDKDVDGLCGTKTSNAIKVYQKKNGLTPDGHVGLNTWKKILGV